MTYALSLFRSTMGMAREGVIAIRATKSLKRADLEGMVFLVLFEAMRLVTEGGDRYGGRLALYRAMPCDGQQQILTRALTRRCAQRKRRLIQFLPRVSDRQRPGAPPVLHNEKCLAGTARNAATISSNPRRPARNLHERWHAFPDSQQSNIPDGTRR